MNDPDAKPGDAPDQDQNAAAAEQEAAVQSAEDQQSAGQALAETDPADQPSAGAEPDAQESAGEDASAPESSADGSADDAVKSEGGANDEAALAREAERIAALFTRSDASVESLGGPTFRFARWSQPIAPAFFGLGEESAGVMRTGFREAAELAGASLAGDDEEVAPNILVYAVEDWRALRDAPQLAEIVPDLEGLIRLLSAAGVSQYRIFTFSPEDGLRFCVTLLRYDNALSKLSAPSLALGQAAQALLLWSDEAFAGESPVTVRRGGKALIKSRFARLLKAAYAPETPAYSEDAALAERLAETMRASRRSGEENERENDRENADDGGETAGDAGEDTGRRRRTRRRRGRGEDRGGDDAAADGGSESSASDSGAPEAGSPDEGASNSAPAPAFDPLGGDPRPLEPDAEEAGGSNAEERD